MQGLWAAGIAAVVDLAGNEPAAQLARELTYCRFPLVDGEGNPPWLLRAAVDAVAGLLQAKVPTLVCCSAGMSRSLLVAGAAVARLQGRSLAEGLAAVACSGPADVSRGLLADLQRAIA